MGACGGEGVGGGPDPPDGRKLDRGIFKWISHVGFGLLFENGRFVDFEGIS